MNNKKGFTLVEVLAVIVVLGLISVIIVPKVINTVNDSKKESYKASVNNLVKALNGISADKRANLISFEGCSIDFDNDVNTCTDLDFSGELPDSGSITVDSNGNVNGSVEYGNDRFFVDKNNVQIELLPAEYVRVNYIESTGTQYIDTGISYNENNEYAIDCDVAVTLNVANYSGWNAGGIFGVGSLKWNNGSGTVPGDFDFFEKTKIILTIEKELSSRTIMTVIQGRNSATIYRTHSSIKSYTGMNYPIFAYTANNGILKGYINMKLWNMKITVNGQIVRDFIPCYRKSDNVIGLYDVINGKFYTNSGTGEFIKG